LTHTVHVVGLIWPSVMSSTLILDAFAPYSSDEHGRRNTKRYMSLGMCSWLCHWEPSYFYRRRQSL